MANFWCECANHFIIIIIFAAVYITLTRVQIQESYVFRYVYIYITVDMFCYSCSMKEFINLNFTTQPCVVQWWLHCLIPCSQLTLFTPRKWKCHEDCAFKLRNKNSFLLCQTVESSIRSQNASLWSLFIYTSPDFLLCWRRSPSKTRCAFEVWNKLLLFSGRFFRRGGNWTMLCRPPLQWDAYAYVYIHRFSWKLCLNLHYISQSDARSSHSTDTTWQQLTTELAGVELKWHQNHMHKTFSQFYNYSLQFRPDKYTNQD